MKKILFCVISLSLLAVACTSLMSPGMRRQSSLIKFQQPTRFRCRLEGCSMRLVACPKWLGIHPQTWSPNAPVILTQAT